MKELHHVIFAKRERGREGLGRLRDQQDRGRGLLQAAEEWVGGVWTQDLICNSPYCLLYSSCYVNLENLVLDQLIIPKLIFSSILITCLLDIVLIL